MNDKRKISAMNSKIIGFSDKLTKAIVAEVEEILEDAENVVKEHTPARFVRKTLASIEAKLENEGIEVAFDKAVTREALKKTASEEINEEELEELASVIAEAIVDELEDVLEDADSIMDEERDDKLSCGEDEKFEVESKLKSIVERKLHAKGIYVRFARTAKKVEKKTIVQKIREAADKKKVTKKANDEKISSLMWTLEDINKNVDNFYNGVQNQQSNIDDYEIGLSQQILRHTEQIKNSINAIYDLVEGILPQE